MRMGCEEATTMSVEILVGRFAVKKSRKYEVEAGSVWRRMK